MTSLTPWRTGTSSGTDGRTIYTPSGGERGTLIGVMDTREDADLVVRAVNALAEQE